MAAGWGGSQMRQLTNLQSSHRRACIVVLALGSLAIARTGAEADEGGVSFWVPGTMRSLSAAPPQPAFAFANIYYHAVPNGGPDVAFARQITRGNITVNFAGNLNSEPASYRRPLPCRSELYASPASL